MIDSRAALALVERIYAAAYDPSQWRDYAEALRRATDATSAHFLLIDPSHRQASIYAELIGTPSQHREYEAYFWQVDKWREIARRVPVGSVLGSHEVCADAEFAESEFYRDFLRRWGGDLFYFGGGVLFKGDGVEVASGVMRERKAGPVDAAALALLRLLMPHLKQAFAIHRRLTGLQLERDILAAMLDRAPFGVIVLDREARVVAMNAAAERLIAAGDALQFVDGALRAAHGGFNPALQRLVHGAIGARRAGAEVGGPISLPRASGRRPLGVLAAPAPRQRAPATPRSPAAILILTDPEAKSEDAAEALMRVYGLTRMEARVATLIAEGGGVRLAAEALGVTQHTARAHLKAIYAKTGLHNQVQLARLVGSLAPISRPEA